MTELAGILVSDYFLLECLSREGIVETYRARPISRGGYDVVLRLFRPPFPDPTAFAEHFACEIEKVWQCHHPNIQPLLEFGTGADLLFTVTACAESETLADFLDRQPGKPLVTAQALQIITQVASAVQYAHEQNIVHGNVQPASILLQKDGTLKLTNFGLRRAYQEDDPMATQLDGVNPEYGAPEQSLGVVRPASDIYALGVLLYRLLTGALPYSGATPEELMFKHINDPLPSLRALRPDLPEALEIVLRVALSKTPEARFSSATAFLQAVLDAFDPARSRSEVLNTPLFDEGKTRRILVRSRKRPAVSWARAASFLTISLLVFGVSGVSLLF